MTDEPFEDEIRKLIASSSKIEAIKRYREKTGTGLAEAKDAVEAIAAGQPLSDSIQSRNVPPDDDAVTDEVVTLLERGEPLLAIKLVRERTSVGLKEAKEIVEQIGADRGLSTKSGGGCLGAVLLCITTLTATASWLVFA